MTTSTRTHRSALALASALAVSVAPAARAQQPPQPAPEIQRMTALAGKFEGDASFTRDGKTVKFTLHHENRVISGGFGLQCHEEADIPGMGHYEAENLFGWDAGKRELHLFSVSNDPYAHDHAGRWTDATHATLRYEGKHEGKSYLEAIPMEITSVNEYRFRSMVSIDGKPHDVFVATMKRVGQLSAR